MTKQEYFRWDYPELPFIVSNAACELDNLYLRDSSVLNSKSVHELSDLLFGLVNHAKEKNFIDCSDVCILYELLLPNEQERNKDQFLRKIGETASKLSSYPKISKKDSEDLRDLCVAINKNIMKYRSIIYCI